MLWILMTAAAAPLQVARNALQRGLVGDAGPWGATLVRFLFGLPFSLASFAVATVMQQASLPFSAVFGWLWLGDGLNSQAWAGIATTTAGLAILSWPRRDQLAGAGLGSALGLASGAAFAVGLNAYRQAGLLLDPHHPIYSATASVCAA